MPSMMEAAAFVELGRIVLDNKPIPEVGAPDSTGVSVVVVWVAMIDLTRQGNRNCLAGASI